ncbi:MAG: helix-turn-helix transcriptional regulator [Allorhizobium sp.]
MYIEIESGADKARLGTDTVGRTMDHTTALGLQLRVLAQRRGMDYFLVTAFPQADRPELAKNHIASNWPPALLEMYAASDAFSRSPLIAKLKENVHPVFFPQLPFVAAVGAAAPDQIGAAFAAAQFNASLAFSLHDKNLKHYAFVFSGVRDALEADHIGALLLGCMHLLDTSFDVVQKKDEPYERLSARELECLRWSAAGKSSEEIAIILDISVHTVISYLKSAMRKLNAVNRMQAVARACRLRIL